MSEWPTVKFHELSAKEKSSISKPYGSAFTKNDYTSHGIPMVRGVNLAKGIFHDDDFAFISTEKANKVPGAKLKSGDLVFTHRGTVGQVSMIPRKPKFETYVASTSQVKARLDPNLALPEFYYYWFQSPEGQHRLLSNTSTVGVPGLGQPVATIKAIDVPHPPIAIQQGIIAVLGTLDDKIAVNEHIATKALELTDTSFFSETESIAFGTETFGSVARVAGGGTPKTKEKDYWEGDISWTTPTDITALSSPYLFETSRRITQLGLDNCASQLYPAQSIFMTSRATIGAFALPQVPASVNQGFIVVLPPTEELRWWLFHEMRSRVDEMRSLANGSTFLELSRKNFKAMPVRMPGPEVLQRFSAMVGPLHRSACNAAAESRTLAELRDTLLPQLMSGKLRVKDAEKLVEDAT